MSELGVQKAIQGLINDAESRALFKSDKAKFLSQFDLNDGEVSAFDDLSLSCLMETAEFMNNFSDAELSIGSLWIREPVG